jgi:hypothetical protein
MSEHSLAREHGWLRRMIWRALDLIVTALLVETARYPEEYDWARELPW